MTGPDPSEADARTEPPIGAAWREARDAVESLGVELLDLAEGPNAEVAGQALDELREARFTIGVIGQVKAGKSTFVNAFVRRPGLLPTDVNPWTAVVTELRFGLRDEPAAGGVFEFFDGEEWRRIAEDGGKLRELAERLVPGFDVETLREQLTRMRARAEARLGRSFRHLLGKRHRFDVVTSEILERYVCAGPEPEEDVKAAMTGRFSDITKAARLYMEDDPFAFPAVVLDTPGVNDPLLVRDEITCRALDRSDVHIVVLAAHQALSTADLALLRMLNALRKERLIVFVNRVDELEDPASEGPPLVERVRDVLSREFPGVDAPVLLGSAHWAGAVRRGDADEMAAVADERFEAYARSVDAPAGPGPRARMAHCSGLPRVSEAVAAALDAGPAGRALAAARSAFEAVASSVFAAVRDERDSLARGIGLEADDDFRARETARLRADIDRLEGLPSAVETSLARREAELQSVMDDAWRSLRLALGHVVRAFAEREAEALREAMADGSTVKQKVWRCNTTPLRGALEEQFLLGYRAARARLGEVIEAAAADLGSAFRARLGSGAPETWFEALSFVDPSPSVGPLSQVVSLDLSESWWRRWRDRAAAPEEKARELERLIQADFHSMVEQLVATAETELMQTMTAALRRFYAVNLGLAERLEARRSVLRGELEVLEGAGDPVRAADDLARRRAARREACETRLARLRDLRERLAAVTIPGGETPEAAPDRSRMVAS